MLRIHGQRRRERTVLVSAKQCRNAQRRRVAPGWTRDFTRAELHGQVIDAVRARVIGMRAKTVVISRAGLHERAVGGGPVPSVAGGPLLVLDENDVLQLFIVNELPRAFARDAEIERALGNQRGFVRDGGQVDVRLGVKLRHGRSKSDTSDS